VQNVHKIIIVLGIKNVLGIAAKPPQQRVRITLIRTNAVMTMNAIKTKHANIVSVNENAFLINGQLTLTDIVINL
jgi:hypothetical protein